ncbi:HpcH/HpaI aldolase family protein [Nocardia aurea]|uniref:HpcH/HpaI aldolase family protein n=1 Tax=Nocardia aurea TaxID=2144174 RepID=UPI0013008F82|nr:aldolase/citrate lyase family protein [Nocardia aurea]
MTDNFADLLRRSERTLFGTWVKMPTTVGVELLALAGFDFVVIDMEHAPLGLETVHELIGAARGHRMQALVRVPDRQPSNISRVLDSGAAGVLVPHVDSAAEAAAVMSAARFPPEGSRGFGPTVRAGAWGADAETYRASGTEAFVAPQLESRAAIEDVAAIASTPGLGALFVGPVDLAVATGLAPDSAEFRELVSAVEMTAERLGIPLGTAVGADSAAARERARRYDFVLVANDASLLRTAAAELMTALTTP